MNFFNATVKKASLTVLFYLIAALFIFLLDKYGEIGAHLPSIGMLAFLALPFISVVLFMVNYSKTSEGDSTNKASAIIHLAVAIGIFFFLYWTFNS